VHIVTTDIEARYTVTRPFRASFHRGGMLHGLLGRALRPVGCAGPSPCPGPCARPGACAWSRFFAPPPPEPPPHPLLAGLRAPPAPLVLRIAPPGAAELAAGDRMSFGLRVLGAARADDLARIEGALDGISQLPVGREEGRLAFASLTRSARREIVVAPGEAGEGRVTVRFDTPVRLKREGRAVTAVDFPLLFAQLWRRLTMVCALYGGYGAGDDEAFHVLRAAAPRVRTVAQRLSPMRWEHLSAERGERKPMSGLVGEVVFEGEVGPFLPALAGGEAVHVGGWTSFGLGRMAVGEGKV
jgi:CRISPR-associated endoribonuclease Cas6